MIQIIDALNSNLWLGFLLNATIKSFAIFAVAGILAFLLRGKSAALRSLVWCLAILGCLLVSLFFLTFSPYEIGVLPANPVAFETDVSNEYNQLAATSAPISPHPPPTTKALLIDPIPAPVQPELATDESVASFLSGWRTLFSSLHWCDWLTLVWAAVALFLFARLFAGVGTVWYISARSEDLGNLIQGLQLGMRPGWKHPVRVRRSNAISAPIMWGFCRPVILLPAAADSWGEDRLRAVLLHELAHVQRMDWVSKLIAQMMCAVYWFNPFVWIAARRMQVEAEMACDDSVLTTGYQSTNYAEHLVDIVRTAKMAGSVSGVSVAIANSSRIEERIRKILAENLNRRPLTKVAAAVGLFVLTCIAVPMGAMRLAEAGNQENALYNEIQSVSNSHPEPLGRDAMEIEKAAWQQVYQLNQEHVISLCDKFLGAFPESRRYDEIWFEKLICFHHLGRGIEFDVGVEAFISQFPTSNYAGTLHKYRARRLESESKFREALAEWDKIDDPTLLHEVYDRKSHLYRRLENYWKETEFDLLRAELILGKPAPEFSHTSIYDVPVSLSDLRGKVVILYHWSTRDGRSSENDVTGGVIARLKRLYAAHKSNPDFALICICIDSRKDLLEKFVKTHTLPGVHLLLKHGEVPHQFGVIGRPHFVVVDKAGILRDSVHRFGLGELELEQLVAALLEEHQSPLDERIVPRIIMARAAYYDTRYERGKSIAEYEKLLAFVPGTPYLQSELSHRKFNFIMEKIHDKLDRRDDATALLNQAFEIIIDASQSSTDFPVMQALQLAHRLSDHGDREKTWALFQLAVNRDDSDYSRAINLAKRRPKILRAIHDMPEYQRLLADTTPTKADVRLDEEIRKRKIHAEVFSDALKSFVAVDADSEIFTGVILTRVGHILVPLSVKEAKSIRVKIRDFQPAKVVAFDAKSDLAVIKADGQRNLRPVVLGSVDLLREYTPTLLPFPDHGQVYTDIWIMSARGHHVDRHQLPHLYQDAVGQPIATYASVVQLDIDNSRAVAVLKVESLGHPGEFIRGDAAVHHDGRLLAISPSKEVKYVNREPCTVQIPIDRIRDALKRMNISELTQLLSTAD